MALRSFRTRASLSKDAMPALGEGAGEGADGEEEGESDVGLCWRQAGCMRVVLWQGGKKRISHSQWSGQGPRTCSVSKITVIPAKAMYGLKLP